MPLDLPKRSSLVLQVAASIRSGIAQHEWQNILPSERALAELFKVSRPTISEATRLLSKQGVLTVRHGCRTRIANSDRRGATRPAPRVVFVTPEPLVLLPSTSRDTLGEVLAHLSAQGLGTEVCICRGRQAAAELRKREGVRGRAGAFFYVLIGVRREVQKWFEANALPTLVLGSCHAAVRLPSFDVDYQAVCRHAFSTLVGKGHRNIALVLPDTRAAGEVASERGFHEAALRYPDAQAVVVRHDGTTENLATRLDAQFNSSRPPTAIVVAKPLHVLAAAFYLLRRGIAVPGRVSLIARDHDKIFTRLSPSIAHYRVVEQTFTHRLTRLMLRMVSHGGLAKESHLIFPRFVAGETLRSRTRPTAT
jgi:DNA-binding LacI/PurR family transcriptional regulator